MEVEGTSHLLSDEEVIDLDSLPIEITMSIFVLLSRDDLAKCSLVCRRWREYCNDDYLWTVKLKQDFHLDGLEIGPIYEEEISAINPDDPDVELSQLEEAIILEESKPLSAKERYKQRYEVFLEQVKNLFVHKHMNRVANWSHPTLQGAQIANTLPGLIILKKFGKGVLVDVEFVTYKHFLTLVGGTLLTIAGGLFFGVKGVIISNSLSLVLLWNTYESYYDERKLEPKGRADKQKTISKFLRRGFIYGFFCFVAGALIQKDPKASLLSSLQLT
eukprot:TRINITY_DN8306_c0_g1_i1.p1 TRINITY_DN8306_c0_g1~~TRINITY_DN8306_c0_g1_i1.p1  ORF type:complete len:274 (+),score=56.89 TRINITY_DN8306_c0_g1_i1:12-833(+)